MYMGIMSSKDWLITVNAVPVYGLAEDSNIELEMADDKITVTTGIGADWSFVENPSEESSIKFTLQRPSKSNAVLHTLYRARTIFPVTLTNKRNGTVHSMPLAMVKRQPTDGASDGAGAQTLEWELVSGETKSMIL